MGFNPHSFKDTLYPQGRVEIFTTVGKPKLILLGKVDNKNNLPLYSDHRIDFTGCRIIDTQDVKNIILNIGKDAVIDSLYKGMINTLTRMAVGDRGTLPSDSQVPKVPVATMTGLYNEVFRSDAEAIIKNIGTPNVHEIKLVKTFSSADIPITAFSNQAKPVINEVGLIMISTAGLAGSVRPDLAAPYSYPSTPPYPEVAVSPYNYPPRDEVVFSLRTYKSVPFEAANDISVTIRYTIYIE